jgi:hypothetical protein
MTRKKILLWFLGIALVVICAYFFDMSGHHGLVEIIGVKPVLDKTKVYGTDWSRNVLFRKDAPGDSLYYEIIKKLESSNSTKGAKRTDSQWGDTFIFKDPEAAAYHSDKINMHYAFVWYEKELAIIIYNGDNFVMVEEFKW